MVCGRTLRWGFAIGMLSIVSGGTAMTNDLGLKKIWAVQLGATDMEEAVRFYTEDLGFTVASREGFPVAVSLQHDGVIVLLHAASEPARIDYPAEAQMTLTLEIRDLVATTGRLRARGVEVLHDEPQIAPVGKWVAIRDPFGNVHHLLEPSRPSGTGSIPSVYVLGVKVTDMEQAERFYAETLGLPVFSRDYLPRSLPLSTEGAMLILHQTAERPADSGYPRAVQTLAIFEVEDVARTSNDLRQRGVELVFDQAIDTPVGLYNGFHDPFGNVIEILQVRPSFIDPRGAAIAN